MITICGDKLSTSDLQGLEIQRPARAGSRWQPVAHYDLACSIEKTLHERGVNITSESWSVNPSAQVLVGGMCVIFPQSFGIPDIAGLTYALGIRHSNDTRFALTFAAGAQVLVCLNGVITGTWVLHRKHTSGLDLGQAVADGVARFIEEARAVPQCVAALKDRTLTRRQADHLLMESGRAGLLPWSQIGQAQDEYEHPQHEEFCGRSAWTLYNAVSEVLKRQNPARQMRSLDRFRQLLLN